MHIGSLSGIWIDLSFAAVYALVVIAGCIFAAREDKKTQPLEPGTPTLFEVYEAKQMWKELMETESCDL